MYTTTWDVLSFWQLLNSTFSPIGVRAFGYSTTHSSAAGRNLPESLVAIGHQAFLGCTSFSFVITPPEGIARSAIKRSPPAPPTPSVDLHTFSSHEGLTTIGRRAQRLR